MIELVIVNYLYTDYLSIKILKNNQTGQHIHKNNQICIAGTFQLF